MWQPQKTQSEAYRVHEGLWRKLRPSERLAWEEEEGQASLIQTARKAGTGEDPADKGGTLPCQDPREAMELHQRPGGK